MKNFLLFTFSLFSLTGFGQRTLGGIESLDKEFDLLVNEDAVVEILAEGFKWSEGPVWVPELNGVLFTDVPENKAYRWDEEKGLSVFLDPSGYTAYAPNNKKSGGNGLILDKKGNLLIAQHGDRRIARVQAPLENPGEFETVVDRFKGKRFHSPNDLILTENNTLYFTDPPYGLNGDKDSLRELDFNGVFCLKPNGDLQLVYRGLSRPNGLAFSKDEKTLYVANSDPNRNLWMAFEIDQNGTLKNERVFFDATSFERPGFADGLKVHSSGAVFATGPGGVLIFSPEGKHLGTILTDVRTANCAFDANEEYLYMTSSQYLLRIKLKS